MANLTEEYLQSLYDQYYDEWHEKAMKQGIQEGLQQGREQGLQQGRQLGLIEAYVKVALIMVTEKGYSIDDALAAIRVEDGLEPDVRKQVETKLSQTPQ